MRAGTKLWLYTRRSSSSSSRSPRRSFRGRYILGNVRRLRQRRVGSTLEQVGDKKTTKMIRRVTRSIRGTPRKFAEGRTLGKKYMKSFLRERERERGGASPEPAEGGPIAHSKAKPPQGAWDVTPGRSAFTSAATNQQSDQHDVRSRLSL